MSYGTMEAAAVRAELERVIASPPFEDSERLVRFLTFVVEQTLAGSGGVLKESVIGVEVFGRVPGYDPKTDPIVRVQARKRFSPRLTAPAVFSSALPAHH